MGIFTKLTSYAGDFLSRSNTIQRKPPGLLSLNAPKKCFISHAYADAESRDRLIKNLPSEVEAIVFPPITMSPETLVSNELIESLMACEGLIYLRGGASDRSFWVAFERDFSLRAKKEVYVVDIKSMQLSRDNSPALDLAIYPTYHQDDAEHVEKIIDFLNHERFFDSWSYSQIPVGADRYKEIEMALQDRLARGYLVVFWSHAASQSRWLLDDIEYARKGIKDFNDRVLFVLLEDVPLPFQWNIFHGIEVQLFGDAERPESQRIDDIVVRLYWLIYKKTIHNEV